MAAIGSSYKHARRRPWRAFLTCGVVISMILMLTRINDVPRTSWRKSSSLSQYLPWGSRGGQEPAVSHRGGVAMANALSKVEAQPPTRIVPVESPHQAIHSVSSSKHDYATTTGRPQTPRIQEQPRGDKVIVVGRTKDEDTSWIEDELPDWQHAIYSVDNRSAPLHTLHNKGHEANPYLTYIIANYDRLPSVMAFIHSHRSGYPKAWHTDAKYYSNVLSLRNLNLAHVRKAGFANLRCNWDPGCPADIQPFREHDVNNADQAAERRYAEFWTEFFPKVPVPEVVATPCCAQFAVSREQVLARPRKEYERMLTYLYASDLEDATLGRVYEYMWHVIFGRDPVFCPELDQCYKDVYCRGRGVECESNE